MIKIRDSLTCALFTSALLVTPSLASQSELVVKADSATYLGQLIQSTGAGVYEVKAPNLAFAITSGYVPAKDEPSVIDLINKYYIYGEEEKFYREVKKLSDRGNPAAWGFYGTYLATENMNSKNKDYHEGMKLLARAAAAGVSSANNNLGMMLSYESKVDEACKIFSRGKANAHDLTNYGLILLEQKDPVEVYLPVLTQAAEAGDPSGAAALAEYYSTPGVDYNQKEALTWYLISYHGSSSMDVFGGFENMINFMKELKIDVTDRARAKDDARIWLKRHPQAFIDSFGLFRLGAQIGSEESNGSVRYQKQDSVLACFWTYYAMGDKDTFAASLVPFLKRGDANAYYMQAHLDRGFVGAPNSTSRRDNLQKAVAKNHPLACLELALDLWIEGYLCREVIRVEKFRKAYELLKTGYDVWYNTKHQGAIGELIFFLGYFVEHGIGVTAEDQELPAMDYYKEAFDWTPLVAGYLGREITDDPIKSFAYLTVARPFYTQGDWFGGVHHWQKMRTQLTQDQQVAAQAEARSIMKKSLGLSWNVYQRVVAGLSEDFSGL